MILDEDYTPEPVLPDPLEPLYLAAGRIVCRKYRCYCCSDRRDAGLAAAKEGPRAFLNAIIAHQGMICGCADWCISVAFEALAQCPADPK